MLSKSSSLDTSSFERAIDTHKESIYRICRIYAVTPLEPEDLFQEVVLQSWRSFSSFRGKSNIGTWLYRVALNVCMSTKLKLDQRNEHTVKLDNVAFTVGQWDQKNDEQYEALKACIDGLKVAERSLVVLYLEELSYREIAEVLGLTENHVAVKMKRIRSKLFDCITKKLGE